MTLGDIIEAIFSGGKKASNKLVDMTYDKMDKMESEISKYEMRAISLSDSELKEAFSTADGTARIVYGKELKDRGYL